MEAATAKGREEYHRSHKDAAVGATISATKRGYHFTGDKESNNSSQIQLDSKADKEKQGPVGGLCNFQGSKRGSSRSKRLENWLVW